MMAPQAQMLPDGKRLHLNHGPIDLIIEANDTRAYAAAIKRFETVLTELVRELTILRTDIPEGGLNLKGVIARRMENAVQPYWQHRVTPMAAVAGAVAEEILDAMLNAAPSKRAYVNNGGDIALHLEGDQTFAIASPSGKIKITADDNICGIATSGWRGRSFSLGIADSVTVLASSASQADVAATLIANAVDLPGSPKIKRQRACEIAPDSDLGERSVTVAVGQLNENDVARALASGFDFAEKLVSQNLARDVSIKLQDQHRHVNNQRTSSVTTALRAVAPASPKEKRHSPIVPSPLQGVGPKKQKRHSPVVPSPLEREGPDAKRREGEVLWRPTRERRESPHHA
jgi:uncharacterized protein